LTGVAAPDKAAAASILQRLITTTPNQNSRHQRQSDNGDQQGVQQQLKDEFLASLDVGFERFGKELIGHGREELWL